MARAIGNTIPEAIWPLFAGDDIEALEGLTFLLLSTTEEGWPHLAMISVGEALAVGPRELRLALWPASTATANLARTGRTTLALVHGGAAYYLRCAAGRGRDLDLGGEGSLASFALSVEDVLVDTAPYAELTSGVRFRLKEPSAVLARWRRTLAALRESAGRTA